LPWTSSGDANALDAWVFPVIAIIAALVGFGGIAAGAV